MKNLKQKIEEYKHLFFAVMSFILGFFFMNGFLSLMANAVQTILVGVPIFYGLLFVAILKLLIPTIVLLGISLYFLKKYLND